MTDTVPYYEDFTEIKKKIWSMLTNAVKDRGSPFRIPVFICGNQSDFDGRIVVLRKADWFPHMKTGILKGEPLSLTALVNIDQIFFLISVKSSL